MALWTVKLDIPRDVCDSRGLWILQTEGLVWDLYFFSVILCECYKTRVELYMKLECLHLSSFIRLPPACSDSLSAGFTSSLHTGFFTTDVITATVRGQGGSRVPPLHPPPQVRERLPGRGLEVKLYSLFGWGWWYLVRAAGLLVFLTMGDLAT